MREPYPRIALAAKNRSIRFGLIFYQRRKARLIVDVE